MKKAAVLLVMILALAGCGNKASAEKPKENASSSSKEESVSESVVDSIEEKESSKVESVIESVTDAVKDSADSIEESIQDQSKSEEVQQEETEPEGPQHMTASWFKGSAGPMKFEAPVSWAGSMNDMKFSTYSPKGPDGEYLGYMISVSFNDNPSGNIESFVSRDVGQYDIISQEELGILGYPAVRLQYNSDEDGKTEMNITYYIQIYPESGLGIISYSAPADVPDLYMEDFERILNSLTVEGEEGQQKNTDKTYVINKATGTFHKPSCHKVKEIENAETVVGQAKDLLDQGYHACEICYPN